MRFLLLLLLLAQVDPHAKDKTAPSPRGSVPHTATLNWQNNSCTTSKPCSIQVYRVTCSGSCPSYPNANYAPPPTATLAVTVNATATNTLWQVVDTDPNLGDDVMYGYVATNTFTSNPSQPSPSSAVWSGTTGNAPPPTPPAPTVGSGNSIQ